jgi:hypothetical protein
MFGEEFVGIIIIDDLGRSAEGETSGGRFLVERMY